MNQCLVNILNYFLYEVVIALLTILAWRGTYGFLDAHLYPDDENLSAGMSLVIGYPLFYLIMYTQSYRHETGRLPKFIDANYPSFPPNLRHLLAFISCVLLWRGFWMFFDLYIGTMALAQASPYVFYSICMIISFLILTAMRTASSINGPMSLIDDEYKLFPLYSNCFLAQWFNRKKKTLDDASSSSSEIPLYEPFTITMF